MRDDHFIDGYNEDLYKPKKPLDPREQLRREQLQSMGVNPNWPPERQVELLIMAGLRNSSIAELVRIDENVIPEIKEELEREWNNLGKPLSESEHARERGKMIAKLTALLKEVEGAYAENRDSKLLSLRVNIEDKLTKLRGLESQRPTDDEAVDLSSVIERKLASLPEDQLKELNAFLASEDVDASADPLVDGN